jgi:hypothetical protein
VQVLSSHYSALQLLAIDGSSLAISRCNIKLAEICCVINEQKKSKKVINFNVPIWYKGQVELASQELNLLAIYYDYIYIE